MKGRYAVLDGDGAVFVVGDKAVANLAKDALDLLDKDLVSVSVKSIQKVEAKGGTPFTLEQKGDAWHVIGSPAPEFTAETEAVRGLPAAVVAPAGREDRRVRPEDRLEGIRPRQARGDRGRQHRRRRRRRTSPPRSPSIHLAWARDGDGKRYARLDQQPAVVVLDAADSEDLGRTHLDFLDHRVLKYDLDTVTGIARQMKDGDLELAKRDDQWRFAKPSDKPADDLTVGDVLEKTFRLRASGSPRIGRRT